MQTLLDAAQIERIVGDLAGEILADESVTISQENRHAAGEVALVGIRSRGELLAQRLAAELTRRSGVAHVDVGALDITLYRDDVGSRSSVVIPQGTEMNFRLDDRPVILIDDVLETGRSVRAALDALVDFGRPRLIRLAVLIDRGRREFPIQADYVGLHVTETHVRQKIVVTLKPTDDVDGVFLEGSDFPVSMRDNA